MRASHLDLFEQPGSECQEDRKNHRQQLLFDLRQDFFAEEIELSWIRVGQADDQGVEAFR
jgi:hypothetical protein